MPLKKHSLTRYAWLSLATALLTIALKTGAYMLTGSVGMLSDAVESLVNLAGAVLALIILSIAAQPADEKHPYGHSKAEYFSSAFEGVLIIFAAFAIVITASIRLFQPHPLEQMGVGLLVSLLASLFNLGTARILLRAGKQYESITLEADGQHLMTDVWTSAGVLGGLACAWLTGWIWLDAVIALLVGLNIFRTGGDILRRSVDGLMDTVLPAEEMQTIEQIMNTYREQGIMFHALRARRAASERFVSVHMLVPGDWTVHRAHCLAEEFENAVRAQLKSTSIITHLESLEDSRSFHHGTDDGVRQGERRLL
ncbi:MAG: cation transporter [Desulfobulbaceae bacterium]|nr:cation transporter [Desulfobulbaceae bacterium]